MIKRAIFVLLGLGLLLLAWGLLEPYRLDVEEQTAVIPGLPAAWDGREVGVIGDLQLGMWLDNRSTVARAVDELIARRPSLVLLTGDFVYHAAGDRQKEAETAARLLRPLIEAGIPTFAVLGNHDYSATGPSTEVNRALADRVRRALEAVGVTVLVNETAAAPSPDGSAESSLYVIGLGARLPGLADADAALAGLADDAPRIVIMHHPDTFAQLPAHSAPLAVAGHTHGGQISLPFTPEWSWLTFISEDEVHTDGWISDYGAAGNHLYVNRGIGMSLLPLRISAPPEVTIFTLRPSEQ